MGNNFDMEFSYKGHQIQVSAVNIPDEWSGTIDIVFTVTIDGEKTVVPGIWRAYKADGKEGVTMVIKAFLNNPPIYTHG